jgi:excisionase family DNA binding protein
LSSPGGGAQAESASVAHVSGRRGLGCSDVAQELGLSVWQVRRLAESGDLPAARLGRRWVFDPAVVTAWQDPGATVGVRRIQRSVMVPSYRYVSPDRRPHVELLESLDLTDDEIAAALGVAVSKVRRWHEHGVASNCVGRLRALAERFGRLG